MKGPAYTVQFSCNSSLRSLLVQCYKLGCNTTKSSLYSAAVAQAAAHVRDIQCVWQGAENNLAEPGCSWKQGCNRRAHNLQSFAVLIRATKLNCTQGAEDSIDEGDTCTKFCPVRMSVHPICSTQTWRKGVWGGGGGGGGGGAIWKASMGTICEG